MRKPTPALVKLLLAITIMGAITALTILTVESDIETSITRQQHMRDTYGVEINKWTKTTCLNGWLIVRTGTHGHLYVRDAEFKPIRCKE